MPETEPRHRLVLPIIRLKDRRRANRACEVDLHLFFLPSLSQIVVPRCRLPCSSAIILKASARILCSSVSRAVPIPSERKYEFTTGRSFPSRHFSLVSSTTISILIGINFRSEKLLPAVRALRPGSPLPPEKRFATHALPKQRPRLVVHPAQPPH